VAHCPFPGQPGHPSCAGTEPYRNLGDPGPPARRSFASAEALSKSSERGVTVISATHDYKMLNVSDRVVWIRDGCIDKIESRDQLDISVGAIGARED